MDIEPEYPKTKKIDVVDVLHDTKVVDPYRWLEDSKNKEVNDWDTLQNDFAEMYLRKIKTRKQIQRRLSDLLDAKIFSTPLPVSCKAKRKPMFIQWQRSGKRKFHDVYYSYDLDKEPSLLIDGDKISEGGNLQISDLFPSYDGRFLAYTLRLNGSDKMIVKIMDIDRMKTLDDVIPELENFFEFKLVWADDGFFYIPKKRNGVEVAFHKIGADYKNDSAFVKSKNFTVHKICASEDHKSLLMHGAEFDYASKKWSPAWYKRDIKPLSKLRKIFAGDKWKSSKVELRGSELYALVKEDSPNGKIVKTDIKRKNPERSLETIIAESSNVIDFFEIVENKLVVGSIKDAVSGLKVYTLDGKLDHNVELPKGISVNWSALSKLKKEVFFSFWSFSTPIVYVRYDVDTKSIKKISGYEPPGFDQSQFSVEQIFYTSKDGTKVPMFIVHKNGLKLDGNNPVILYGYGGFSKSLLPEFSVLMVPFLEAGGLYAVANIRGGGEYGEKWHREGMLDKKQNSFDDFIAASEYLIKERYTNPNRLAIRGESNGGLLVAACSVQRPDLYKAVLCEHAILDMLRYGKFGNEYPKEYGSTDNPEQFNNLLKYSPYHNVKKGVSYPATFFITSDSDDRVSPSNARKMAAMLQDSGSPNSVLFRSYSKSGHGNGSIDTRIQRTADEMAFIFDILGMEYPDLSQT